MLKSFHLSLHRLAMYGVSEGSEDEGEWRNEPPVAELRYKLKDPRTKHQYNPFCRLLYL